ncbi:hypothetical protein MP638_005238 [Amoeboaphelidium occidentale]|nr:hypothetical protein MP638_005238 [Amoeboaphelidium occidentale]
MIPISFFFFFCFCFFSLLLPILPTLTLTQKLQPSFHLFKHVVIIGLDGLAVEPLQRAMDHTEEIEAKNLKFLRDNGVYSYNARSVFPTVSYPNWNSILTGTETSFHGIDSNLYQRRNPAVVSVEGPCMQLPNIFSILKSFNDSQTVGAFYAWDTIGEILQPSEYLNASTVGASYAWDTIGELLQPSEYLNASVNTQSDEESTLKAIEFLNQSTEKPQLTFLYLSDIDDAGHGYGTQSKEYMEAIKKSDKRVGRILETLSEKEMMDDTLILVVTDHGRKLPRGQYHGSFTDSEMRTTWIAYNKKRLKQGHELEMPLMNSDTAPTVLYALGVNGGVMPVQMRSRPVMEIYKDVSVYSGTKAPAFKGSGDLWKYTEKRLNLLEYQQCLEDFHLKLSPLWGNWDLASYSAGVIVGVLGTLLCVVVLLFVIVACGCWWMNRNSSNYLRRRSRRKGYVAVGGSEGN